MAWLSATAVAAQDISSPLGRPGGVNSTQRIDLSGEWQFALDPEGQLSFTSPLDDTVRLPGTTDTNQKSAIKREPTKLAWSWPSVSGLSKGTPCTNLKISSPLGRPGGVETTHLSRRYSYVGRAWYRRTFDIPKNWKQKYVYLFLERTKPATVWIDGHEAGSSTDISTPQVYLLGQGLKPGTHTLTIAIDNSAAHMPQQILANSHACTEDTQTNWNGIIGRIEIITADFSIAKDRFSVEFSREFDAKPTHCKKLSIRGQHIYANGHRIFLRGKHDACVWPLTGHVPMDTLSWFKYLRTCQQYGINHIRFHSWCPPEACFLMADRLGIYLQPELPFWGDFNAKDTTLMAYLHKEGENILRWYGHHPSFVMFALGNELWGSIEKMGEFIEDFRRIAPDKLYTFGSNFYLGYQGAKPGMDYFTTCRVGGEAWGSYNTHTRASFSFADAFEGGILNHFRPNSSANFDDAAALCNIPVIGHETGQFQIYPDYDEIKKYKGVLAPYNLEEFQRRLRAKGMANQSKAFHRASGRWSALLYKADIEMNLRSERMAGFQLLDLQDYPGQGSAYVGILDAFMETKHLMSAETWSGFCADVVPLFVADSLCFTSSSTPTGEQGAICGTLKVANYGGRSLRGETLQLVLAQRAVDDSNGKYLYKPLQEQTFMIDSDEEGLINVQQISLPLTDDGEAKQLRLSLTIDKGNHWNHYDLWSYPQNPSLEKLKKDIVVTNRMTDEIGKKLKRGARVLWMPDSAEMADNTLGPLFQTDYWNYRMFRTICENNKKTVSPGTMGILCNPRHALFNAFPTDEHTNWQWWPVITFSRPLILDAFPQNYFPMVQVIDNIERSHKLGLVMEFSVGKGRLLVCMSKLEEAARWPEGRQFYRSVLEYMHSESFNPKAQVSLSELKSMMTNATDEQQLEELNNISPY